jgi:ParB/RepB/Spo0J family partition protein
MIARASATCDDHAVEVCVASVRLTPRDRDNGDGIDRSEIGRLARSIRMGRGRVTVPIIVRPLDDGQVELVAGLSRLLACIEAGVETVQAVVRNLTVHEAVVASLIENAPRRSPPPLRIAWKAEEVLQHEGCTQRELAERLCYPEQSLSEALAFASEVLPRTRAEEIAFARRVSVTALEKLTREDLRRLRSIKDDSERATAVEQACENLLAGERATRKDANAANGGATPPAPPIPVATWIVLGDGLPTGTRPRTNASTGLNRWSRNFPRPDEPMTAQANGPTTVSAVARMFGRVIIEKLEAGLRGLRHRVENFAWRSRA